jgi:hypothetical protein
LDIFERANKVGKYEELMTKRDKFDWNNIPEL